MPALAKPEFSDAALLAQANFRALMDAMARPGLRQTVLAPNAVPAPLTVELAAMALTLADHETTLWLDPALAASAAVADYIRFETGTRIVADPAEAAFALVSDAAAMPPFSAFAIGSDDYPDRSTTILIAVDSLIDGPVKSLVGPGIETTASLSVSPWQPDWSDELVANRKLFPRGVDLVFSAAGEIVALPRTTKLSEA